MQNTHSVDFKWFMSLGLSYKDIVVILTRFFQKRTEIKQIKEQPYFKQFKLSNFVVNFYTSGKLLIQGQFTPSFVKEMADSVFVHISNLISYSYAIGLDEAGKGEKQGALVFGALGCKKENIPDLITLGVTDSKTLKPQKLLSMANVLQQQYETSFYMLAPHDFNKQWKNLGNLNILLEQGHSQNLMVLIQKIKMGNKNFSLEKTQIVIDKFTSNKTRTLSTLARHIAEVNKAEIILENKAEYYPFVAGASIIAKAEYERTKNNFAESKNWKSK